MQMPVLGKGVLIVLLGVVSEAIIALVAMSGLQEVKTAYQTALVQESGAALQASQASRTVQGISRQAARLVYLGEGEARTGALTRIEALQRQTVEALAGIRAAQPGLAGAVQGLDADVGRLMEGVRGLAAAPAADTAALRRIMAERVDPQADRLRDALDRFVTERREAAGRTSEAALAVTGTVRTTMLVVSVVALAIGIALATALFALGVARPMRRMAAEVERVAGGTLDAAVEGRDRRDEVGAVARAVETLRVLGLEKRGLEASAAAERAARDRRQAAMDRHTQDFGQSVSGVLASLGAAAADMRRSADAMAAVAERARDQSASTAAGAEQSSHDLGTVAAATEELSASVAEISRQVAQAAAAAQDAVNCARTTDTTVRSLSEAAAQIGEVVRLISDIAGQTNLLALNATIEAARAGEAGKGFAVVASEVKALAGQTAKATEQIASQVAAIQAATTQAVDAVQEVGTAIGRVEEVASAIAAAVEEQGAATREIAASVQTVARQNNEATRAMNEVADIAESAGGTSRSVLNAAGEVARVSGEIRTEVDSFLAAMRGDERERRRYERLSVPGLRTVLRGNGLAAPIEAMVQDIARGGLALVGGPDLPPGLEVQIELPGAGTPIGGRVARREGSLLAIAFRQDPETLARVDALLDTLAPRAKAA
ncbi:methyl-accepting chemotaxis protein [Paracraurococcus ruber]|nr:methyl-accepting chemotaxis protein [Paracraurococcus ruber]